MADRSASRRWRVRRRALIGAGVVVVVGAGGGAAWALTGDSGPRYRLATVTRADVTESVDTVGTIRSANRASVTFPVSGKVSSVAVQLGQRVTAGQTLASLDTTSLSQKVDDATSTLASAQQTLANDEAIQDGTATSTTNDVSGDTSGTVAASSSVTPQDDSATQLAGPTKTPRPTGSPTRSSASSGSSSADAAIKAAQQDVRTAQQQLLAAEKALDAALNALGQLTPLTAKGGPCAAVTPAPRTITAAADSSGTIAVTADPGDTVTIPNVQTPTPSGNAYTFTGLTAGQQYTITLQAPDTVDAAKCADAIAAIVATAKPAADGTMSLTDLGKQLSDAQSQLQAALGKLAAAQQGSTQQGSGQQGSGQYGSGNSGSSSSTPSTRSRGGSPGTGNSSGRGTNTSTPQGESSTQHSTGTSGSGRTTTRTVTAQQLAADQAAIDAANANLGMAKQNLAQAVIVSPIAGTVADVGLTAGASSSGSITVIGQGSHLVDATVPLTEIDQVKVGERATVTVDGIRAPLTGTVTYIGVLGSGSGSTTSYPITITLSATAQKLFDGTGASVDITTSEVSGVLTVPTSAVHSLGAFHTVTVVDNGKETIARVTVGAVGPDRTEIRSGLSVGQQVLLASLSEPIPTGNSNTGLTRRLGGGGLGGGGLGGGLGGRIGR